MTPYVWVCEQYTPQTLLIDIVSASHRPQILDLNLTLTSRSNPTFSTNILKTISPNSNGFHRVDIELPVTLSADQYNLNLTATAQNGYSFSGSLRGIECRSNQNGMYIITDKPIYRESEKGRLPYLSFQNIKNTYRF